MTQRKEEPRKQLTVGDLREALARVDADVEVCMIHPDLFPGWFSVTDAYAYPSPGGVQLHLATGIDRALVPPPPPVVGR